MTGFLRRQASLCVLKQVILLGTICFSLVACTQPSPVVVTIVPVTMRPLVDAAEKVIVTREVEVTRLVPVTATPPPPPPPVAAPTFVAQTSSDGSDEDTLLLLHFDEPAGTTLLQDSSPYEHHALCHSAACPTRAERGLNFNGQDSYIMSSASIQGLSSFTLAGWFHARSYEHAGKLPVVFMAPGEDCGRAALRIGGGYTEGPALFVADTDNCTPQMVVAVSAAPELNQWYHIVAVFDSDTDRHAIYINGEKVAENEYPIGPIADTTPGHPMWIGVNYSPRPYDRRWWDGYIDEVVLYSRALSASEVEALYRSTR